MNDPLPDQPVRDLYQFWTRMKNKINESERTPRRYGIEILLTPAEIHLIQAIGDHPGSNVRTVALVLGITPGAASQMITRLAKKELIQKVRGRKNEKEVHLELTSLGETAYQEHKTIHEMVFQRILERVGAMSAGDIRFLTRILHGMETVYDERIEEVMRENRKNVPVLKDEER